MTTRGKPAIVRASSHAVTAIVQDYYSSGRPTRYRLWLPGPAVHGTRCHEGSVYTNVAILCFLHALKKCQTFDHRHHCPCCSPWRALGPRAGAHLAAAQLLPLEQA